MPRKAFEPTALQTKQVQKLAMYGLRDSDIAAILEISERTLQNYFKEQLSLGRAKGKEAIAQTAFQMATSGENPTMTIFLSKVKLGWKDNVVADEDSPKDRERRKYILVPMADCE